MVIQPTLLAAVQLQLTGPVTVMVPDPLSEEKKLADGESVMKQLLPVWFTVTSWNGRFRVVVRGTPVMFFATVKVALPLPTIVGEVIVIQLALLTAPHWQLLAVVTVMLP
jgi:hypothetical protein